MIAVTAYPVIDAVALSLQRADLRFPNATKFIGLANYGHVLSAPVFWQDVLHTVIITVISVSIQFVLGMCLALAMHRVIFARGFVRGIALVPYAIVAVVAAESWMLAWSLQSGWIPGLLGLSGDPLSHTFGTYVAVITTEVWKNTPFMALLLLAGLALVPDDLLEAAKVDGATTWQRFTRITLPLMKPAILVALLFRTLDAFRIFDTIYIFNQGAQGTESISMLNYNTLLDRLNLGLGSAVSVVLFLMVALIAFVFIKGFGAGVAPGSEAADEPARQAGQWMVDGDPDHRRRLPRPRRMDRVPVAEDSRDRHRRELHSAPVDPVELLGHLQAGIFTSALRNSIGIGLISTLLAVMLASSAAYAIARLDFPGKRSPRGLLRGGDVPADLARRAAVQPVAPDRPVRHLARADHPVHDVRAAAVDLVLSSFFREIPWELEQAAQVDGATPFQAFRKVIVPLAMPGIVTTFILVFIICWNDFVFAISLTSTTAAETVPAAISSFPGVSQFSVPYGDIAAAAVVVTIPVMLLVLLFQRRIVSGLTAGAVKG